LFAAAAADLLKNGNKLLAFFSPLFPPTEKKS
jgi:hypothetical protein